MRGTFNEQNGCPSHQSSMITCYLIEIRLQLHNLMKKYAQLQEPDPLIEHHLSQGLIKYKYI